MQKVRKVKIFIILLIFCFTVNISSYAQSNYLDISDGYWGKEAIDYLSKNDIGVINGYPDKTFKPSKNMSRQEFIKMLVLTLGNKFDITNTEESWEVKYIKCAKDKKIIGDEYTSELLQGEITRYEVCKMIFNSFTNLSNEIDKINKDMEKEVDTVFLDISNYDNETKNIIYILNEANILNGYQDGTSRLNQMATRAELASFMYRIHNNLENIKNFELIIGEYDMGVKKVNMDKFPIKLVKKFSNAEVDVPLDVKIEIIDFQLKKIEEIENKEYINIINQAKSTIPGNRALQNVNEIIILKAKVINNTNLSIADSGKIFLTVKPYKEVKYLFTDKQIKPWVENRPEENFMVKPNEVGEIINFYSLNDGLFNEVEEFELIKEFTCYIDEIKQIANIPHNINRQGITIKNSL